MKHSATNLYGLLPDVQPETMTPRARLYLITTASYCLAMASACLLLPDRFGSVTFEVIKRMLPFGLEGWALAHLIVALLAMMAAWHGRQKFARRALIAASGVVGPWAGGFLWALFSEPTSSPTGAIAYTFITIIHLIQARQALRSPFDPLVRGRVADE
jgi:hypothetical protein